MQNLEILNTREVKKIKERLQEQFGFSPKIDYAYLKTSDERIFIINKDVVKVDLSKLKVDKLGLYFAEIRPNQIRLSKEGTQLLAKEAEKEKVTLKNVVELTAEEIQEYFKGASLEKDLGRENKLIILSYEHKVLGCTQYKNQKILNFLPKINRGDVIV